MKIKTAILGAMMGALVSTVTVPSWAEDWSLPIRANPRPLTTDSVPHVQLDVEVIPELKEELLRRVAAISGIEIRRTVISLPGAKGFWIKDDIPLARPEVIVGGREFAHIHPDGSLHASLPPDLAEIAVETGWATKHPWADKRPDWGGFVMIYSLQSKDELDVVFQLVLASYNFVTGRDATAKDNH